MSIDESSETETMTVLFSEMVMHSRERKHTEMFYRHLYIYLAVSRAQAGEEHRIHRNHSYVFPVYIYDKVNGMQESGSVVNACKIAFDTAIEAFDVPTCYHRQSCTHISFRFPLSESGFSHPHNKTHWANIGITHTITQIVWRRAPQPILNNIQLSGFHFSSSMFHAFDTAITDIHLDSC